MSKMTIIEGNSNDKDNVRAYMVKGEPGDDGVSPTLTVERTGTTVTVTATDTEGTTSGSVSDGISPIINVSKTSGVTTVTFEDTEGTKTATINDGEIQIADIVDNLTTTAIDKPLSANQGKVLKELLVGTVLFDNSSGINTDVTLSETAANYDYLEIFYGRKGALYTGFNSVKVYDPNNKVAEIGLNHAASGTAMQVYGARLTIQGTTIERTYNLMFQVENNSIVLMETNAGLYIYTVIGYKY